MTDRLPRVTVLSSIYSDGPFVREAIDSVLRQTFTDFEYLIINDAAIDDSRAIAATYKDPRIRIVDNPVNIGLTKSLNRGLTLSRGELIARFDSNDICFPQRLEKQVAFLDAHPEVAAVGAQAEVITIHGCRIRRAESRRPITDAGLAWACMLDVPLIHGGTMFRRDVIRDELGGYNEQFRVAQDAELWLRLSLRHKLANLPERLIASRWDPKSISSDTSSSVRAGHRERWYTLTRENMRRFLEWEEVPEAWSRLWVEVNQPSSRLGAAEAVQFVDVVDRCFARFAELRPDAVGNPEIARHRAYLMQRAAEKAAPSSRLASAGIFRRMVAVDAAAAAGVLPRLLLLWTAGDLPVRLWRRWRRRNA